MLWVLFIVAALAASSADYLPGVPVDFTAPDAVLSAISNEIANKFAKEYNDYLETGIESAALRQISAQLAASHSKKDMFTKEMDEWSAADQFFGCTACRAVVNVAVRQFRSEDGIMNGPGHEDLAKVIMLDICRRFELQTPEVCGGLFDSNDPIVEYIVHTSVADSRTVCSLFMEFNFCNEKQDEYNWSLKIDQSGPAITGPKADIPSKSVDDMHILHLTDVHYDPLYTPGTNAECAEPLCCQRNKEMVEGTSKAAGYWGDYRDCDLPLHTAVNALEHIQKTHKKPDFIYQTGDVVDHMVWGTSKEKNNRVISEIHDAITKVFPDVPVYSCIGNHEPHPLNVFSPSDVPEDVNTNWMYAHLWSIWSKWLPEEAKDTVLKGGYYSVLAKKGFRVIGLNNNDCYNMNWWLFHDGRNGMSQLEWLHQTLLDAEKAGEHVHILAHIPSGDGSCFHVWAREYNRLIERFSATISGIFNGHSHKDEMLMHYSKNGHAIGVSWNAGALTTFSNKNPNYRIYEVEPKSMQVVDHATWMFNLTDANLKGPEHEPEWFEEYVFLQEYPLKNLSPAALDEGLNYMADHPDVLRKFWRFKHTQADPAVKHGCNHGCLRGTMCRIATSVNNEKKRCNELVARLQIALDKEESTTTTTSTTSTTTTTTTPKPGGAASISAFTLSSVIGLYFLMKYLS